MELIIVQEIIDRKKGIIDQGQTQAKAMLNDIRYWIDDDHIELALRQLNYLSLTLMDLRDEKQNLQFWEREKESIQALKDIKEEE